MATMMQRPLLQDLVKQAMEGTASKVDITAEAARQLGHLGEQHETKTASAPEAPAVDHVPTEVCEKYASALEHLAKQAADPGSPGTASPGVGPGQGAGQVMEVLESDNTESNIDAGQGGQAIAKDVPPKNRGMT